MKFVTVVTVTGPSETGSKELQRRMKHRVCGQCSLPDHEPLKDQRTIRHLNFKNLSPLLSWKVEPLFKEPHDQQDHEER